MAIRGLVRRSVVSFGMLLFCALGAQGQKDVPRLTLQLEREIPVPGQGAAATVHPIKCDARGNIYVRFHGVRYFSAPVVKISPDGERKAVFATEKVPGWDGADIYDFDVGTDGQVYLLAARPTKDRKIELGLISLNDEGGHRFTAAVKLRLRSAEHLAVFSTGEFFLTGFREVERSPADDAEAAATGVKKEQKVEPVTAILDRSGNVIQELQLPIDSSSGEAPGTERRPLLGPEAISMGAIAMGQDGNLYMMFHTEKPKLYVISADGVLVRTLKISPPSEKAEALTLGIAHGVGLIVEFAEKGEGGFYAPEKMVFSLVNPETGERLYDYQSNTRLGGALGCYTPKGLLFLGATKDRQFAILRAVPR